jgi:hypothetical protein
MLPTMPSKQAPKSPSPEEIIKMIKNGGLKDCDNDTISDMIFALYQYTNILHPKLGNTKTQHTEKS